MSDSGMCFSRIKVHRLMTADMIDQCLFKPVRGVSMACAILIRLRLGLETFILTKHITAQTKI